MEGARVGELGRGLGGSELTVGGGAAAVVRAVGGGNEGAAPDTAEAGRPAACGGGSHASGFRHCFGDRGVG